MCRSCALIYRAQSVVKYEYIRYISSFPPLPKQKKGFKQSHISFVLTPVSFCLSGDSVLEDRGWPGSVHGAEQPDQGRSGGEGRWVVLPAVCGRVPAGIHRDSTRRIPRALQIHGTQEHVPRLPLLRWMSDRFYSGFLLKAIQNHLRWVKRLHPTR